MYLTRILLSIVFVSFASTSLAAKKEKDLICHVGSEFGPNDEVYNPDCEPSPEYDCSADAGKIDLIAVSKKATHFGNESHYFLDGDFEWVDYYPEEGVGDDPADFEDNTIPPDGIDDGCELEEEVACPCAVAGAPVPWADALSALTNYYQNSCSVNNADFLATAVSYRVVNSLFDSLSKDLFYAYSDFDGPYYPFNGSCGARNGQPGAFGGVDYSKNLYTARAQHNACVTLIDAAVGPPTEDPKDCTL